MSKGEFMANNKKKDASLLEIAGVMAAGKAVMDLEEIKKNSKIQADEARLQRELHERFVEEQREEALERQMQKLENEEREEEERLARKEEDEFRKTQEYVEKAEEVGLTPFAGIVLKHFYTQKNLMSFIRATERLKIFATKENLEFLILEMDSSGKKLEQTVKLIGEKIPNYSEEQVKKVLCTTLSQCISDENSSFTELLSKKMDAINAECEKSKQRHIYELKLVKGYLQAEKIANSNDKELARIEFQIKQLNDYLDPKSRGAMIALFIFSLITMVGIFFVDFVSGAVKFGIVAGAAFGAFLAKSYVFPNKQKIEENKATLLKNYNEIRTQRFQTSDEEARSFWFKRYRHGMSKDEEEAIKKATEEKSVSKKIA